MTLNLMMPQQADLKPRITVFGVGGAGGNAVNNMIEKALDGRRVRRRQHRCAGARAIERAAQDPAGRQGHRRARRRGAAFGGRRRGRGDDRGNRRSPGRGAHVLHHRRHGRRHRHGCGSDHRAGGARAGRADRRRGDEALPVRRRRRMKLAEEGVEALQKHGRHADHHPEPEPVPACQREDDLHRSLLDGRRRALPGRQGRHRPDGPPGSHQPRLRRRPRGDERDGQGDDGHRRVRGRGSRDPGRREGDRQPAARRDQPAAARRAFSSTSPAAPTSRCSSSTRRPTASATKSTRTPTSSSAPRSIRRWKA